MYNPINGSFVTSSDYKFQPHCTSDARFGNKYLPGTFIYCLDESTTIFTPKFALDSNVLVHTHSPPHVAKVTSIPTYDYPDVYTVLFPDGSISEYKNHDNLLGACPVSCCEQKQGLLPHWIQTGANATLFLDTMPRPRHGKLILYNDENWTFHLNNSTDPSLSIKWPDLTANAQDLLDKGQLFHDHAKFQRVYATRNRVQLSNCVLRHVSSHGLTSLVVLSSLKSLYHGPNR